MKSIPKPKLKQWEVFKMKHITAIALLSTAIFYTFPAHAKWCERVGVYAEAMVFSEHLSNDHAPKGGYNEDNPGLAVGGVCKNEFSNFDLNTNAGLIAFKNSYDDTSKGVTLGLNLSTPILEQWDVFGGTNIVIVDGYQNLADNARIGDETAVLPAVVAGLTYNFTDHISVKGTANFIPSIGDSDGVFLPTFGLQYLY